MSAVGWNQTVVHILKADVLVNHPTTLSSFLYQCGFVTSPDILLSSCHDHYSNYRALPLQLNRFVLGRLLRQAHQMTDKPKKLLHTANEKGAMQTEAQRLLSNAQRAAGNGARQSCAQHNMTVRWNAASSSDL